MTIAKDVDENINAFKVPSYLFWALRVIDFDNFNTFGLEFSRSIIGSTACEDNDVGKLVTKLGRQESFGKGNT